MNADSQVAGLDAFGRIEAVIAEIDGLQKRLERVPLWRPAAVLRKQAHEARQLIAGMQARLERRVIVTIIGPSGAGKSTLLNALAGVDDLSPAGHERPTTRRPVALADDTGAVQQALGPLLEQGLLVQSSPAAAELTQLILVDTPDTDSNERERHRALLQAVIERSDVLICVFDAQNPKRRDHADFMAPLVRAFHGGSLVAVLNKCDRLEAEELTSAILPEFKVYLAEAWETRPLTVFTLSARRHLQKPDWDPQATPLHDLDQFADLRATIYSAFNRPGFAQDRRIANAQRLRDYLLDQCRQAADADRGALNEASRRLQTADQAALTAAAATLQADDRRQLLGVQVRFYQALAQRWLGPVGWLVAAWARLIVFGSGLAALLRFGNPLSQILGAVATWRRFRQSRSALEALGDRTRVESALRAFRHTLLAQWPPIAEQLVKARFDPAVRQVPIEQTLETASDLEALWADRLDAEITRRADVLSRFSLQALFNLPSLLLIVYVGWLTLAAFFQREYLAGNFFVHALLTVGIVLLLTFFVLQLLVRAWAGGTAIQRHAFGALERALSEQPLAATPELKLQIEAVLELTTQ